MGLKRAFPGTELFLRQLVEAASFLDSNLAAKHRCDHGGFTAHHPPLGRRGWQALHSQRSDRRLTGKRMYREMRGSRGSTLALARSVGSRPIKTDSLIPAIIAPFHQLNPCARRNSRLFHEFLTILSGFVTNFSQKNRKTLLLELELHASTIRSNRSIKMRVYRLAYPNSTACNRHAENGLSHARRVDFTY